MSSTIDVMGLGYLGGHRSDNSVKEGRTLGNTIVGGSGSRSGSSYGGLGGAEYQKSY